MRQMAQIFPEDEQDDRLIDMNGVEYFAVWSIKDEIYANSRIKLSRSKVHRIV